MDQNASVPHSGGCRLCDRSAITMHSVFKRAPEGRQVLQLIRDVLRLIIYRTDPLSKHVCDECYQTLLLFDAFKRTSVETLNRYQEQLKEKRDINMNERLFLNTLEQGKHDMVQTYKENVQKQKASLDDSESQEALSDSSANLVHNNGLHSNKLPNGHLDSFNGDSEDDSPLSTFQNAQSQSDMELCDSDLEDSPTIVAFNVSGKRYIADSQINGTSMRRKCLVGPKSKVSLRRQAYLEKLEHQEGITLNKVIIYQPLSLLQCVLNHMNQINVPDYYCEPYESFECSELPDGELFVLQSSNICDYCDSVFTNVSSLAVHECEHMYVDLGEKVDNSREWKTDEVDDVNVRNNWFSNLQSKKRKRELLDDTPKEVRVFHEAPSSKIFRAASDSKVVHNAVAPIVAPIAPKIRVSRIASQKAFRAMLDSKVAEAAMDEEGKANNDHQDLLVPQNSNSNSSSASLSLVKGEIVLIGTLAYCNGTPLTAIDKEDRKRLYKNVTIGGLKRKFCPLCRYVFKDNWAIECHYFSSACHYTCRFCGVRFNKQRAEFDDHVKQHILAGELHSTKVFASRKSHSVLPKVINEHRINTQLAPSSNPGRSNFKIKAIKKPLRKPVTKSQMVSVKQEPASSPSPTSQMQDSVRLETKSKLLSQQNQAYFCRKCYKVFFKLDEFNIHVVSCTGTSFINNKASLTPPPPKLTIQRPVTPTKKEPEKFSPSGRPVRSCVKEIGTYIDDEPPELEPPPYIRKASPQKSARGFECTMCSSCFPTVHSRNSHMRIHKAGMLSTKSITISKKPENVAQKVANIVERSSLPAFVNVLNNEVKVKEEPVEEEEEEDEVQNETYPSNIGAVSITPISTSQKPKFDENIMKLVQNNPNLTIRSMVEMNNRSQNNQAEGELKSYRCMGCSKPFTNKSNLYFHKKNNCSGSKYPCPFCKKRFGTEAAYSSHIFYNHPE